MLETMCSKHYIQIPVFVQNWKHPYRVSYQNCLYSFFQKAIESFVGRVMLKQWARAHWTQSSVGVQRTDIDTGTDTRAGEGKAPTQTIGNKEQLIQKLHPVKHLAKRSLCLWSLLFNISEHMDLQQNQKITEHQSDWKQFWWLPRKVAGCQWESVFIVDNKKSGRNNSWWIPPNQRAGDNENGETTKKVQNISMKSNQTWQDTQNFQLCFILHPMKEMVWV